VRDGVATDLAERPGQARGAFPNGARDAAVGAACCGRPAARPMVEVAAYRLEVAE